jgi:protein O-mannosyl-transferase
MKVGQPDDPRISGSAVYGPKPYLVYAVCGVLLLAVIAVYCQTARHDFVNLDDNEYAYENPHVQAGLTPAGIVWAFTRAEVSGQWHPLTLLSLMADVQILKPPGGPPDRFKMAAEMHAVNVALHAANSVLLLVILLAMTGSLWRSAFVAAVFAVHPLHVESVAWITERKDVLSGLFGLLTVWAYVRYARHPSVSRYLLVFAALALGLMAKPMLITWPFLLLLLDYWPLGRLQAAGGGEQGETSMERSSTEREAGGQTRVTQLPIRCATWPVSWLILEKLPLLLIAVASTTATLMAQKSSGAVVSLATVSLLARISRAVLVYVAYLGKTVWPANLAAVYPDSPLEGPLPALGAAALLALLTFGAALGARRGQPWLIVGWLWYLGTLSPAIGLVQTGLQVMADRFVYLPQIGLCVAFAWGVGDFVIRFSAARCPSAVVSSIFLCSLAVLAWHQAAYWRDSETLWTHSLACTSNNSFAHSQLGKDMLDRRRVEEAIAEYRQALEINPRLEVVQFNLGVALAGCGRIDQAMVHYRKALEIVPDDAQAHNNLGRILADRGRIEEGAAHYLKALQIDPNFAEAHFNLGLILSGQGRLGEAVAEYRKAVEIKPGLVEAQYNLGILSAGLGLIDDAIDHFRQALAINADFAEAQYNLGTLLAGRGQIDVAIAHFQKAVQLKSDYLEARRNLGLALVLCGRTGEAMEQYQTALAIAVERSDRAVADDLRARIQALQRSQGRK